jgi:hypothetical protein
MQFDMGKAWNQAISLLSANREVMSIVAGVFFFLPTVILTVMMPTVEPPAGLEGMDALNFLMEFYQGVWIWIFIAGLAQSIGTLALIALLSDRERPTVGEAIKTGLLGFLPQLAAQFLVILAIFLPLGILLGVSRAAGVPAIGILGTLVAVVVMIYAMVKISLSLAVVGIERRFNPIYLIQRSWTLTKGNSLRLFGFYFLLGVVYVVVSLVIGGMLTLVIALMGQNLVAQLANGIVSGAIGAVASMIWTAVLAAVYLQLAGPSHETEAATFE